MEAQLTQKKGINGAVLKWFAVVTMFIDHAAAMYYPTWLWRFSAVSQGQWVFYRVLRCVGRSAFPIYCFLLVEGFLHTRDVKKYMLRLLGLGILSELPFDLALWGRAVYWKYQNVYFTLLLGLLAMTAAEALLGRTWEKRSPLRILGALGVLAGCMGAAKLLRTDYSWKGVLVIAILYTLREKKLLAWVGAYCALLFAGMIELAAVPAFVLLFFYNGERGRQSKVHLVR